MMVRGHTNSVFFAVLIVSAVGCTGPSVVSLSYQRGTYVHKVTPVRVGVYYFDDERPGWPATAAMRMFADSANQGMLHTEGDKPVHVFVAESLRAELAATGMKVSTAPEFNRQEVRVLPSGASDLEVDRVVLGRINYFGFVGPVPDSSISAGAAVGGLLVGGVVVGAVAGVVAGRSAYERRSEGVTFGDESSGGKAYIDIDLWVVEPSTGKILWASTARGRHNSGISSGAVAARVAAFLSDALGDAFREALWRRDFLTAMGATQVPAKVPAQVTQASTHEQTAKKLFQAERFAEAAAEFEVAYKASADPALLFNMALCYRKAGYARQSLAAYDEYLRKAPDSPQRPAVEARIKELKQQLAAPSPAGN